MAELTSTERVMLALHRQEPDRVPHFEWLVDRRVREALCPGSKGHHDFAVQIGHDAVIVDPIFRKERISENRWLSEWGYVTQDTEEEHGIEVESPIKTMADFERFTPPNPHLPARFTAIESAVQTFKGKKAVIVHLND